MEERTTAYVGGHELVGQATSQPEPDEEDVAGARVVASAERFVVGDGGVGNRCQHAEGSADAPTRRSTNVRHRRVGRVAAACEGLVVLDGAALDRRQSLEAGKDGSAIR